MQDFFVKTIELATQCGVKKILIDPGLGFYYANLQDSVKRVRYQMREEEHDRREILTVLIERFEEKSPSDNARV